MNATTSRLTDEVRSRTVTVADLLDIAEAMQRADHDVLAFFIAAVVNGGHPEGDLPEDFDGRTEALAQEIRDLFAA